MADAIAYLAGDQATVERNVKVPGRRSGTQRQIDILVTGRLFGLTELMLMVDCKRYGRPVDVKDVESFISMAEDVGADVALLVVTQDPSGAARNRAKQERGIQTRVMTIGELNSWSPPGTVTTSYRVPVDDVERVTKGFRNAGFRTRLDGGSELSGGRVVVETYRHYGTTSPSGDIQRHQRESCEMVLNKLGVEVVHAATGITMAGGTPGSRWLEVAVGGQASGIKILAATEQDAERELDQLSASPPYPPRQLLSVLKPEGWPVRQVFGL